MSAACMSGPQAGAGSLKCPKASPFGQVLHAWPSRAHCSGWRTTLALPAFRHPNTVVGPRCEPGYWVPCPVLCLPRSWQVWPGGVEVVGAGMCRRALRAGRNAQGSRYKVHNVLDKNHADFDQHTAAVWEHAETFDPKTEHMFRYLQASSAAVYNG